MAKATWRVTMTAWFSDRGVYYLDVLDWLSINGFQQYQYRHSESKATVESAWLSFDRHKMFFPDPSE